MSNKDQDPKGEEKKSVSKSPDRSSREPSGSIKTPLKERKRLSTKTGRSSKEPPGAEQRSEAPQRVPTLSGRPSTEAPAGDKNASAEKKKLGTSPLSRPPRDAAGTEPKPEGEGKKLSSAPLSRPASKQPADDKKPENGGKKLSFAPLSRPAPKAPADPDEKKPKEKTAPSETASSPSAPPDTETEKTEDKRESAANGEPSASKGQVSSEEAKAEGKIEAASGEVSDSSEAPAAEGASESADQRGASAETDGASPADPSDSGGEAPETSSDAASEPVGSVSTAPAAEKTESMGSDGGRSDSRPADGSTAGETDGGTTPDTDVVASETTPESSTAVEKDHQEAEKSLSELINQVPPLEGAASEAELDTDDGKAISALLSPQHQDVEPAPARQPSQEESETPSASEPSSTEATTEATTESEPARASGEQPESVASEEEQGCGEAPEATADPSQADQTAASASGQGFGDVTGGTTNLTQTAQAQTAAAGYGYGQGYGAGAVTDPNQAAQTAAAAGYGYGQGDYGTGAATDPNQAAQTAAAAGYGYGQGYYGTGAATDPNQAAQTAAAAGYGYGQGYGAGAVTDPNHAAPITAAYGQAAQGVSADAEAGAPQDPGTYGAMDDSFDDEEIPGKKGGGGRIILGVVVVALVIGLGVLAYMSWERAEKMRKDAENMAEAVKQSEAEVARVKAEVEKAERDRRWFAEGCGDSPTEKGGPMCAVPSGQFWRGCNASVDKECDDDEKPYRQLYLNAFYLDRHEVTVQEYGECVAAGQCKTKGLNRPYWDNKEQPEWEWACNWKKSGRELHPINCIEWQHAADYCAWVGKRLPTEAEWEKGARGADGRKYPWGNTGFDKEPLVANIADETALENHPDWTVAEGYRDSYYTTSPVETYPRGRSPYGAVDMIGNVWEWVSDFWLGSYYKDAPAENPRGPESGEAHVLRGGSWEVRPSLCRVSARDGNHSTERFEFLGFRCALSAPEAGGETEAASPVE